MKNNMDLSLKNKEWKEFSISSVFKIKTGANIPKHLLKKGNIPRITATDQNNGVFDFTNQLEHKNYREISNFISVTFLGSVFYHPYNASLDMKIHALKPLGTDLNKYLGEFLVHILKRSVSNASYGNQISSKDLPKKKILLPVNSKGKPDLEFMETFMKLKEKQKLNDFESFISKKIKNLKKTKKVESLEKKEWGEFFIADVTDILSGRDIYATARIKGNTPYISSTANNNGIGAFVGNENLTLESECLSVNRNGSVGYSFYHSYPALFSNDCRKLRLKKSGKHIGIFISQQITRQKGKYGYGYKMGTARLKRQKIMLPINDQNEPDYVFMENYMKQLEYKKLTEYLKKKKN